jgi:predicted nucleic acid-binding Zn ribbon protein
MKRHNDRKIADILNDFVHQKSIEKGYWQNRVEAIWKEHMGLSINSYTRKIKLNKGVLSIYLNSAPLRQELNINKEKLVLLINEKIGENRIQEIRLY